MKCYVDMDKGSISQFFILDSEGKEEILQDDRDFTTRRDLSLALRHLVVPIVGSEKSVRITNHMDIVRDLELADYEPSSDKGHFRYYPNGALMYQLLTEWCRKVAEEEFLALPIRTPFIYRSDDSAVKGQIGVFDESIYYVRSAHENEELVLRFNDDLGLFSVVKGAQLTYKHMPFRIYEHTPSFRYIKSGSLAGINKGRYFSLTDIHSFCASLESGLEEYVDIQKILDRLTKEMDIDFAIHLKIARDFYGAAKSSIVSMLKSGEKMLVESLPQRKQYWDMKHIVCTNHPQRLFHVQLDLINSERFGIKYISQDNRQKNCVIIHTSIGTPERWIIISIENALKKDPPVLPLWLAPTQIRILPVSEERHVDFCVGIARELKQHNIRVDIDERSESLSWRIRAAEREWIPYTVVCGDKEVDGNILSVRERGGSKLQVNTAELARLINQQTTGMPFRSLPGLFVSKRPVFRGRD